MFAAKDHRPQGVVAYPGSAIAPAPADISGNLRQESQIHPFVFNRLRTLWSSQILQLAYFQSPTHSLPHTQNVTTAFTITSPLFVRSSAQERKSTPLVSCACALFREMYRGGLRNMLRNSARESFTLHQLVCFHARMYYSRAARAALAPHANNSERALIRIST
jgi:hypothetical protein